MYGLQKFLLFHVLTSLGPIAHVSGIVQGDKVPEGEMPFMASVQVYSRHRCGGFLITEDFVVTTTGCELPDEYNLTEVVVGTNDLGNLKDPQTQTIEVEKIFKHSCDRMFKDIMLLKLSSKVQMNKKVATIKLSTSGPRKNDNCYVAGWGKTRTDGPRMDELRAVNVSIVSQADCEDKWSDLPPSVICAGGYKTTKGFCRGDEGGPLVCNGEVVGVASFNRDHCNYPDYPNVYKDVSRFQNWINTILEDEGDYE